MIFPFLLVFVLVILIRRIFYLSKWNNFPGFKSWCSIPLLGHAYRLGSDPIGNLYKYQKQFGNIFRMDIGKFPTVIICNYKDAQEVYKKEEFSGRPFHKVPFVYICRGGLDDKGLLSGISVLSGKPWKEHRHFIISNLSDIGMGKKGGLEELIMEEAEEFCDNLKVKMGKDSSCIIKVNETFAPAVNNVIWRLVSGERAKQTDPDMVALTKKLKELLKVLDPSTLMSVLTAHSEFLLKLFTDIGMKTGLTLFKPVAKCINRIIDKSSPNAQGTITDRYLAEIENNEKEGNVDHILYGNNGRKQIFGGILDLMLAGTDTSGTFLEWCFLFMMQYPDVQERVFLEIKETIGLNRPPTCQDRSNTPYCEAVIEEMMRVTPEAYLNLPHMVTKDTHALGYFFPKNTQVLVFYGAIQNEETHFDNAKQFLPERYLDKNGKFHADSHVTFFGVGKRRCLGEAFAKMEIYLFFVTIFQNFQLKFAPNENSDVKTTSGLVFSPAPFNAVITLRS